MMLHMADADGQAARPMPSYFTARLLTGVWTLPGHGLHRLVTARVEGVEREPDVVAYAVERPDRKIAVLLINRSATRAHRLVLTQPGQGFTGRMDIYSYGPTQYAWIDAGAQSRPARSLPPIHRRQDANDAIDLPVDTLAVVVLAP